MNFLNIQGGGASQREMLALFRKVLEKECKFSVDDCGVDQKIFVYLDDAIFSGGRVHADLAAWVKQDAPADAVLHVIVIATHQGFYYNKNKILNTFRESGKTIKITWCHAINLENRKGYTNASDVLSPASIPADPAVQRYINGLKYQPRLRTPGQVGQLGIFSSDAGRQILEQEFLKAGVRILGMCPRLNQNQRPLGNTLLDTIGFGSLIVTFRNCPNNAPLALWVGAPWYPLLPRATNSDTSRRNALATLAKDVF